MSILENCVKAEGKLRRAISFLPPGLVTRVYSPGRKLFIALLKDDIPEDRYFPPEEYSRTLWGLKFSGPVMNAAGMFKKGEGYRLCVNQGAGAWLAGTSTGSARHGNQKNGVLHPFMPLPFSGAALNWMGLPNAGTDKVAAAVAGIGKRPGCPVGASISASPDIIGDAALRELVHGMETYRLAGADFIELNESCPNVPHESGGTGLSETLVRRLGFISEKFLAKRRTMLPVVAKFSNDTDPALIPGLVDLLADLGFDGINLGNTSVKYDEHLRSIAWSDRKNFEYFTTEYGGGLSGKPLRECSLALAGAAARHIREKGLPREFRVIRTGGFFGREDLAASESAGIDLNQWFTGYFEGFAARGHSLYKALYEPLFTPDSLEQEV